MVKFDIADIQEMFPLVIINYCINLEGVDGRIQKEFRKKIDVK